MTEVACRYEIARQTMHTWLRRYTDVGMGASAHRPTRPSTKACSSTAIGKVELLHKTMRTGFVRAADGKYETLAELQDDWMPR